jgi:hypothetical protein
MREISSPAELHAFYLRVLDGNQGRWFDFDPVSQTELEHLADQRWPSLAAESSFITVPMISCPPTIGP